MSAIGPASTPVGGFALAWRAANTFTCKMRIGPSVVGSGICASLVALGCEAAEPAVVTPIDDAGDAVAEAETAADAACDGATQTTLESKVGLAIVGDPGAPLGFGDPSILYPPGADRGFMSYTAVDIGAAHTRLAGSTDRGASWTYLGEVNAVTPATIATTDTSICGAASCTGRWIHEVSSLVEDPTDPDPARRFKVFTHTYFSTAKDDLRREIGTISLWTTATLRAGAVFSETRLLGWLSSSPETSTSVATVITTDAALAPLLGKCNALTEPAALVRGSTIDLALGCIHFLSSSNIPIEIVQLRSADHGRTWSPVGMLLDRSDAEAIGARGASGPQINAPELVDIAGKYYLLATPNGPVSTLGASTAEGYRGCYLYPFADIDKGILERCAGKAVVARAFVGPAGLFHGACAYAPGADAAGLLHLTADIAARPPFRLVSTGLLLP